MVLSNDPGESYGWALWTDDGELVRRGTTPGWAFVRAVDEAMRRNRIERERRVINPRANVGDLQEEWNLAHEEGDVDPEWFRGVTTFVLEDFILYPEEAMSGRLNWDRLRTVRFIGAMTLIADQNELRIFLQPAKIKSYATAQGAQELFDHPLHENRHQNDAIMHGVFYFETQKIDVGDLREEITGGVG